MSHDEGTVQERRDDAATLASLIADLSIRFINLPADQVDRTIEDALRLACAWFDLDLGAVWQRRSSDSRPRMLTHYYSPVAAAPEGEVDPTTDYPWSLRAIMDGQSVSFTSLDQLPTGAGRDRQTWHDFGVKSGLALPLGAGGSILGVLGFLHGAGRTRLGSRGRPAP